MTNQTTLNRYHELFQALSVVAKVECDQDAELDGRTGQSRVTHASYASILEITSDVIIRNMFPRATVEQRNALLEVFVLRELTQNGTRQDLQSGFEAKKALVRHLFPLDAVSPLQRHYLETAVLA